ncbi:MAG: hypothetical protein GY821_12310 [Gammaproteobacteria bacterium]|nr:hypothetical protein [Gammaproteobacteria bacterium]
MTSVIHSQSCHSVVDWIPLSIDEINYLDGVIYALMQTRQANPCRNAKLHQRVLPSLQSWFVMLPLTVLPTEGREQYYRQSKFFSVISPLLFYPTFHVHISFL